MNLLKRRVRNALSVFWIAILVFGNSRSILEAKPRIVSETVVQIPKTISKKDILSKSQLSYRASGGFTEVGSYAVIVSCVDGKISTYRAVHNNRHGAFRKSGTLSEEAYLNLWDDMLRRRVFDLKDAPAPKQDILDEFTVEFEAKAGEAVNKFSAVGCSRPEAAAYFALRNLLDQAADMKAMWDVHTRIVRK